MDLLLRDVPDEVVAALDAEARRLGLSRSEVLRRALARTFPPEKRKATMADLARFEDQYSGLADEELMTEAWR
ncbi:ribbon-helix-helix protein, CopG family [Actinoplanes sp. DH11]|uniref:type II toxin-antitoxin system VapB family antitoxin n=1 Tax=Actinoplanes sp. DH11 TaxID=2857011 RepID=UPI001E448FA7|nr:CopG family transcriptional regulator [Actinoplanes sp. DH11]